MSLLRKFAVRTLLCGRPFASGPRAFCALGVLRSAFALLSDPRTHARSGTRPLFYTPVLLPTTLDFTLLPGLLGRR